MFFEKAFNMLETNTDIIWIELSKYQDSELNQPLAPGKWSALQHMVHINKSERSLLVLLYKAIKNKEPLKGSVLKIRFRSFLYKLSLNNGLKIEAPVFVVPSNDFLKLEDVKHDFTKTRHDLRQLLSILTDTQKNQFWVYHKNLHAMRAIDILNFMCFHQNHHQKKIMSLLQGETVKVH